MIAFVAAVAVLSLVIVGLIARPLVFRRGANAEVDPSQLNASLLKEEFASLENERAIGSMSDEEYRDAREDLARRLLDEASAVKKSPEAGSAARPLRTVLGVALIVPVTAGVLYAAMGTPGAIGVVAAPPAAAHQAGVEDMVGSLAAKLASNPDNPTGWAMLARSYTVLGRYDDAVAAYEKIGPDLNKNSEWLAAFADAAAMKAGGNPVGRPEELSLQALKLDPDNVLALMMAGYGAATRADFEAAVPLIERALKLVQAGSDDQRFLEDLLSKSRAKMGGTKK
jgi:cytochrome c-type biogenesis protein CcmH